MFETKKKKMENISIEREYDNIWINFSSSLSKMGYTLIPKPHGE